MNLVDFVQNVVSRMYAWNTKILEKRKKEQEKMQNLETEKISVGVSKTTSRRPLKLIAPPRVAYLPSNKRKPLIQESLKILLYPLFFRKSDKRSEIRRKSV